MLLLFVFLWLQQPSFGAADGLQKADSLLRLPDVNVTAEAPAAQTGVHPLLYSVTRQDFRMNSNPPSSNSPRPNTPSPTRIYILTIRIL